MTNLLSRRAAIFGAACLALAPPAFAAPELVFPLRLAYARIGRQGFMRLTSDDQLVWSALQTRLGGLIEEIEPIQPTDMLGVKTPEVDGGASCAMAARQAATHAGFDHVILYATQDGKKKYKHTEAWSSKAFAAVRSEVLTYAPASGEAHLLDVGGGPALASVAADAPPRQPTVDWFTGRNPEREALLGVTMALERRLQAIARSQYEAQRSIAD